jgi:LacI family transcriptional regulator, galactose operon repressor
VNVPKPRLRRASTRRHPFATIKDVAAEAGVSTATVSRVMAGSDGVTRRVRDRVMRAVEALDYHPNRLARHLRSGRRKIVGVIIPDLQNPFFPGVVHGVEEVLYTAGYTLMLGHSDGLAEREERHIAVLRGEGAAGLILIPDNGPGASYESLQSWDIPVVAVDRAPHKLEVDLVTSRNREGVREAVAHLVSHGYRDIALIGGPAGLSVSQERLAGYRDALRAARLPLREALVAPADFRQAGGRLAMARLLSLPKPPRAVVSANNLMTLGALEAIYDRNLRVPDDVAVIGFDDMSWATSLRPALTAVVQPAEELGRAAAQLLLERIKEPERLTRHIVLPTRLTIRASCGAHPVPGAQAGKAAAAS